jgi:hypothetical protein
LPRGRKPLILTSLHKKGNFYGKYYELALDAEGTAASVTDNKEVQRLNMKECGFIGFLDPISLSCERVLGLARNRDYIEKDYECYKTRMRRLRHSLEE